MRLCPFHCCKNQIPDTMFCCRQHWGKLSAQDKEQIGAIYSQYKKGDLTVDELRAAQQKVLGARGDSGRSDRREPLQ